MEPEFDKQLSTFTLDLIGDLRDLRKGKITNADARVRAQLAREALRSVHLMLQGMNMIAGNAKPIEGPKS